MAESDLIVRDAREDELVQIRDLTMSAYAPYAVSMDPAAWAGLEAALVSGLATREPVQRIVAEADGRLVGSVMLYPPAADVYAGAVSELGWPELRMLAVASELRGRGIGTALLNECIRRARASGASDLGLHTSGSMDVAIRMYERMGFVRAPEFDFRPEGAELVTAYRLSLLRE